MTILNEYLSYLDEKEEDDNDGKKSKWKDRLKKYGKIAVDAATVGAAVYAGSKAMEKYKQSKTIIGTIKKGYKDLIKKQKKQRKISIKKREKERQSK